MCQDQYFSPIEPERQLRKCQNEKHRLEKEAERRRQNQTQNATITHQANVIREWKQALPNMLKLCVYLCRTDPPSERNGQVGWSKSKIKTIGENKGYIFTDGMLDEILAALPEELRCKKSRPK